MGKIIAIHSLRRGVGKSNITVNVAALLAATGDRIGLVDLDLQSPSTHVMFNANPLTTGRTLNDYLQGSCPLSAIAQSVQPATIPTDFAAASPTPTQTAPIYLVPGSQEAGDIARLLRSGYDTQRLIDGFEHLMHSLELDYLLIDTHPGLGEEALLAIAVCDVLLLLLAPEDHDIQDGAVSVDVARKLGVPQILPVVNLVLDTMDPIVLQSQIKAAYCLDQASWLPFSEALLLVGSYAVFCCQYPDHPFTEFLRTITRQVAQLAHTRDRWAAVMGDNGNETAPTPCIADDDTSALLRYLATPASRPPAASSPATGLSMMDLVILPTPQRQLLTWMLRQTDVTQAQISDYFNQHSSLSTADVSALLTTLLEKGYIQELPGQPLRYRPSFAPPATRQRSADFWQIFEAPDDTS